MSEKLNTTVVVKEDIRQLRTMIEILAQELRDHIGAGGDAHPDATATSAGFLTPDMYDYLMNFQDVIDGLKQRIALNEVPVGTIFWWPRSESSVPTDYGYALCDGNNGTVNLRNRFIIGIDDNETVKSTVGSQTLTINSSTVPDRIHTHTIRGVFASEDSKYLPQIVASNSNLSQYNPFNWGGIGEHGSKTSETRYPLYFSHTTSASGGRTDATINIEPPYKVLRTIQKITKLI